jgi:hypothetical protein
MDEHHTSKFINASLDFLQSQSLLAFFWREFGMVVFFFGEKRSSQYRDLASIEHSQLGI